MHAHTGNVIIAEPSIAFAFVKITIEAYHLLIQHGSCFPFSLVYFGIFDCHVTLDTVDKAPSQHWEEAVNSLKYVQWSCDLHQDITFVLTQ